MCFGTVIRKSNGEVVYTSEGRNRSSTITFSKQYDFSGLFCGQRGKTGKPDDVCSNPEKAVGNWMYVEYKGVQGYAYNNYLQSVSRTVSDGKKAEHPHMSYNQYSNGYVEDLGYQDNFACSYVHATCTEQGYEILQCMLCDYREKDFVSCH